MKNLFYGLVIREVININNNISCVINSNHLLEDFERPFKVIAGPGAGKTYWLVNNIKNILNNSQILHRNSKIACITYTNIGVEEINTELSSGFENVEVATIHSFLYKNILRPYIYLLNEREDFDIDVNRLKGQENNIPNQSLVDAWKREDSIYYIDNSKKTNSNLRKALGDLKWEYKEGKINLTTKYIEDLKLRKNDYIKFKKYCWRRGIIYHDDIIYLSYMLLSEFKYLGKALSSRYTYLLLDEFQDTNIIQSKIVKILAESGCVVGVIGDPAQSIYKFQGATRQEFINFKVANQVQYILQHNRRSGKNIVDFLNVLRADELNQIPLNKNNSGYVFIYEYGNNIETIKDVFYEKKNELNLQKDFSILAYKHEHINLLKSLIINDDAWDKISLYDGDRYVFIYKVIKSYRLYSEGLLDLAFKEMISAVRLKKNSELIAPFKSSIQEYQQRSLALNILLYTVQWLNQYMNQKYLKDYYNDLSDYLLKQFQLKLPKISRGDLNSFASECLMKTLVEEIKFNEVKLDEYRTIHGVKGAEFESVLVFLESIDPLVKPNISGLSDSTRIFYVGCSRPKTMLFIAVPKIDDDVKKRLLRKYGLCIEIL